MVEEVKSKHVLTGTVISNKMHKTVVVRVEKTFSHPRLKKVLRSSKTYKVHDEDSKAKTGDVVMIYEGRPKSKSKYMYLAEIVKSGQTGAQE